MAQKVENRQILRNVPADDVQKVIALYRAEGATSIKTTQEPEGTFTVEAVFSD